MATQSPYRLPQEVFVIVVSNLPLRDLVTASLVSRTWNNIALPYLYHDVYFSLSIHLQRFEQRLARDGDKKRSPRFFIRNLTLETPYKNSVIHTLGEQVITERDLSRIDSIVSSLTQLYHFSWDLPFFPKSSRLLENLQSNFDLRTVSWIIKQGENDLDYDIGQYWSIFDFQHLTQFTLSLDYTIAQDDDSNPLDPVPDLVESCPNLESFTICLRDGCEQDLVVSMRPLAAALRDAVFPSLHTFRIHGPVDPDWHGFFNRPDSHPLRTFFSRHPGIRTLGIGNFNEPPYPRSADPESLSQLFPSLTHLEAPPFVCTSIISSKLASQLQSLVLLYNEQVFLELDLDVVVQAITPLPKLRRLAIHGNSSHEYSCIPVDPLNIVLDAMPVLEELALHTWLAGSDKDRLFDVLKRVPGLRILGIDPKDLPAVQGQLGAVNLLECVPAFLQVCPRLERINLITGYDTTESWSISRKPDGNLAFTSAIPFSWPNTGGSV